MAPPPRSGELVAERFRLLAPLVSGRLGELWTAFDERATAPVVVRFLAPYLEGLPGFRAAFLAAGERLCGLDHPNVARGVAVGTDEQDRAILACGFLAGRSLAERLASGRTPPREAAATAAELCDALAYLHEKGVVHGDLRPSAVRADQRGALVLLDPGLPEPYTRDGDEESPRWDSRAYASPDLALAGPSRRTDLYSVAAICCALVTGEEPIALGRDLADRLPSGLAEVLTRAVAIRAELGFPSAAAMGAALRAYADVKG
jgi:serine/threonine-protein kinase